MTFSSPGSWLLIIMLQTTIAGSLPKPSWLAEPERLWVLWFNTERPHEYLDDFTPEAVEKLHYDHRRTPPKAG